MKLKHCIVHEIKKEAGIAEASAHYSEFELEVNNSLADLILTLIKRLDKGNVTLARFEDAPGKLFPQRFDEYLFKGANFVDFTTEAIGHLETIIKGKSAAKGGYLLFCSYEQEYVNYEAVFLIRNTKGQVFEQTEEGFIVNTVIHLDTEQLIMACRIDVTRYKQESKYYLELMHRKEHEVSAYFSDWLGIEKTASNKAMTSSLQELLGYVEMPTEDETEPVSATLAFERAYQYVSQQPNKIVDIEELSKDLYGSKSKLVEEAEAYGIPLEAEFKCDSRVLKNFVQIQAKADQISLSFPRRVIEEGLVFIEGSDEDMRLIIESPTLAKKVLNS